MKFHSLVLLAATLAIAGCTNYSTVKEIQPVYRSSTPSGHLIARTLKKPSPQPLVQIGSYLDAASSAATVLRNQPGDTQARRDYNFAVSRIFGIIHDQNLKPWKAPLSCPGADRVWSLSIKSDPRPERNPSKFDIQPADIYQFKGSLVRHSLKDGIGAPLVVVGKAADPGKAQDFEVSRISYGMTGLVNFKGDECDAFFLDPLAVEDIAFEGHQQPLAADFTAPIALALAIRKPREKELDGLFRPSDFESKTRLARLQPYDPNKIPVLCIHGLGDSQATWAPLIETLRGDPVIRKHYQFWFYSYPTGYPYPLTASVLRKQLDAINDHYPDHKKIVVIGHSMGGMISRTLITDSDTKLWYSLYDKPPAEMPFSSETRTVMSQSLIFKHRTDISRVIFASASHRGSDVATSFIGRLGSALIGSPADIVPHEEEVLSLAKPNSTGENLKRMPNSIDFLKPTNRFVVTLDKIPVVKGIPYHSIIGDRGKGGNLNHAEPVSTDGIVPYWSSHIDGAKSELIIPSHHWSNQHPLGIAEIDRILHEHLKTAR